MSLLAILRILSSDANRELSGLFSEKKTPHEYRELPGNHSWAYWDQQVKEVLRIAAQKLKAQWQRPRANVASGIHTGLSAIQ